MCTRRTTEQQYVETVPSATQDACASSASSAAGVAQSHLHATLLLHVHSLSITCHTGPTLCVLEHCTCARTPMKMQQVALQLCIPYHPPLHRTAAKSLHDLGSEGGVRRPEPRFNTRSGNRYVQIKHAAQNDSAPRCCLAKTSRTNKADKRVTKLTKRVRLCVCTHGWALPGFCNLVTHPLQAAEALLHK